MQQFLAQQIKVMVAVFQNTEEFNAKACLRVGIFSYARITITHLEIHFLCSQDRNLMKSANNQQSDFLETIKTETKVT